MLKLRISLSDDKIKETVKAQRGIRSTLYSFFNLGVRWGSVVSITPWPLYPRERGGWMGFGADSANRIRNR